MERRKRSPSSRRKLPTGVRVAFLCIVVVLLRIWNSHLLLGSHDYASFSDFDVVRVDSRRLSPSSLSMSGRESFDPTLNPLLSGVEASSSPIRVGLATIAPLVGEAMHILYDGVQRSDYLELVGVAYLDNENDTVFDDPRSTLAPSDAQVWIVDGARVVRMRRGAIDSPFLAQLFHAQDPSWRVLVVDFSDTFSVRLPAYDKRLLWNESHIRLAVRSVVEGRGFDKGSKRIKLGEIAPNRPTAGGPTLHCPYCVRSDTISRLQDLLRVPDNSTEALERALFSSAHDRSMDVLHLWNIVDVAGVSRLRNNVSRRLARWNDTLKVGSRKVRASYEEQGPRFQAGRNSVAKAYIKAMLSSKIVIVAQKDNWEDHYRLFETMVCGPLVIADRMIAPPAGIIHGENIIFFDDLEGLKKLVVYYLNHEDERAAIARRGWQLALNNHRSWHRMEQLFFGKTLTKSN